MSLLRSTRNGIEPSRAGQTCAHDDNYANPLNPNHARRGQVTCPPDKPLDSPWRGPWLDHRSGLDAHGLTRFAGQTAVEKEIKEKTEKSP